VQDSGLALPQIPQAGTPPSLAESQGRPAQLLGKPRGDPGSQSPGHQLATEINPQRGQIRHQTPLQQVQFVGQERIVPFLVDADWSPQDDEQLRSQGIELRQIFYSCLDMPGSPATLLQHSCQIAEILKRYMPDN
jgi:hypothetical protein